MSIIRQLPDNSRIRFPQVRFEGAFDGVAGVYDFNVPANQNQVVIDELEKNSLYLIEQLEFRASVGEEEWLEAMNIPTADFPFVRIHISNIDALSIYAEPVRSMMYRDAVEHLIYFRPSAEGQQLLATFRGQVNQPPSLVGVGSIATFYAFNIYQIWDKKWIQRYEAGYELGRPESLVYRGPGDPAK